MLISCDSAWLDAGGQRGNAGCFEPAPRQRAQYRRRNALLDDVASRMARVVAAA